MAVLSKPIPEFENNSDNGRKPTADPSEIPAKYRMIVEYDIFTDPQTGAQTYTPKYADSRTTRLPTRAELVARDQADYMMEVVPNGHAPPPVAPGYVRFYPYLREDGLWAVKIGDREIVERPSTATTTTMPAQPAREEAIFRKKSKGGKGKKKSADAEGMKSSDAEEKKSEDAKEKKSEDAKGKKSKTGKKPKHNNGKKSENAEGEQSRVLKEKKDFRQHAGFKGGR